MVSKTSGETWLLGTTPWITPLPSRKIGNSSFPLSRRLYSQPRTVTVCPSCWPMAAIVLTGGVAVCVLVVSISFSRESTARRDRLTRINANYTERSVSFILPQLPLLPAFCTLPSSSRRRSLLLHLRSPSAVEEPVEPNAKIALSGSSRCFRRPAKGAHHDRAGCRGHGSSECVAPVPRMPDGQNS